VSTSSTDTPVVTRMCFGGIVGRGGTAPTILWSAPKLGMTSILQNRSGRA
jgi:hypothetical protein